MRTFPKVFYSYILWLWLLTDLFPLLLMKNGENVLYFKNKDIPIFEVVPNFITDLGLQKYSPTLSKFAIWQMFIIMLQI